LLAAAISVSGAPPATGQGGSHPRGPDVRVVNTASEPVPVTGEVNVASLPAVQVGSLPAVQLDTSSPLRVVDVDNPARQPFSADKVGGFEAGLLGPNMEVNVPAGKRLVIEFASFQATIPQGQHINFFWVDVLGASGNASFYFPAVYQGSDFIGGQNVDLYTASGPTRLYADPGSKVTLAMRRNTATGTGLGTASISGHFVNVP
jgi:hypothetical protein